MTEKLFIFGAGYSGQATAIARLGNFDIAGTTRSATKFDALRAVGIEPHIFAGELTPEIGETLGEATHLLVSIAPDESGDPVLNAARHVITGAMPKLRWLGYLSTVGVYGDHGGAWVDETGECQPVSRRSKLRLEAEQEWQEIGRQTGLPVAVLRLSGIYGPGRNAFVNLENGTAKRLIKPGQVFNRIHGEDIAGAVWHLAGVGKGGIFNVTDDQPSPPQDVVAYAADLMGVAPPPEMPFETAELSPMARSFYGENKRVSNAALKNAGYRFRYPDYRSAFDAMWQARNWKDGPGRSRIKAD
jgi:nucleoside-diphosphate-sugar epimerase